MVSSKIVGIIAIFDPLIAKICENKPLILPKFWFTALHSSVFGKVRELVGEIKYAFDSSSHNPTNNKAKTKRVPSLIQA